MPAYTTAGDGRIGSPPSRPTAWRRCLAQGQPIRRWLIAACTAAALSGCGPGQPTPGANRAASGSAINPPAVNAAIHGPAAASSDAGLMASELQQAQIRGSRCSVREAKATGLLAEYFDQPGWRGKALLSRLEGPLNGDWPGAGQQAQAPVRSARWRGWVRAPVSGLYAFHVDWPEAQIRVSGQALTATQTVHLDAGRYHPIHIELEDLAARPAGAVLPPLNLAWTAPHGARYTVPKAVMFKPSDTVQTPDSQAAEGPAKSQAGPPASAKKSAQAPQRDRTWSTVNTSQPRARA
jgi:hypothetical protein